MRFVTIYCVRLGLQALLVFKVGGRLLPHWDSGGFWCFRAWLLDLMSRHIVVMHAKDNPYFVHFTVLCDSLRCSASLFAVADHEM